MSTRSKFFSRSKGDRRPAPEPAQDYRTGGLVSIAPIVETTLGDTGKETYFAAEVVAKRTRKRPRPNLTIIPDYNNNDALLSPAARSLGSANNLLALVNDMLRSPVSACPRSSLHKPLPSRPRSVSLPSTPEPVELPGSILLDNQGFPSHPVAGTMRSVRSGNSLSSSAARSSPSSRAPTGVPRHQKSLSETSLARRSKSRPNLITSPPSTDSKLTTCSVSSNGGQTTTSNASSTKGRVGVGELQPSPLIVRGKPCTSSGENLIREDEPTAPTPTTRNNQIEELKSLLREQDSTIETLQSQFGTLNASHEARVSSLREAHDKEVATLREYNQVLEAQQSQRPLHRSSSNHLLLLLDTTETPQSPGQQSIQHTASSGSANSIRSFQSTLVQSSSSASSPHQSRSSDEMENLKRTLSRARRPETGNREMIRELHQYKQNNAALSKQIESLMTKLNQSKKNERNLQTCLEQVEKVCNDWQAKVQNLESKTKALQNTVEHLEYKLEVANADKVDAEEHLFNLQSHRSLFDPAPAGPAPISEQQNSHSSASTVFSSGASPIGHANESHDPSTLSAFISHIERLQEQVKQKDVRIDRLQLELEQTQRNYAAVSRELAEANVHAELQTQLANKTKQTDAHIEKLRTVIIDRESIIGEKDKALRMAERQLEHHKLLLHAEIRRHATLSLRANLHEDKLPDLSALATKEDIDRWIERLQKRLKKDKAEGKATDTEASISDEDRIRDLKQEIDFYVREIVYFKLDIKGYKSDIKKLKQGRATRAGEVDSPTPSLSRSADTPTPVRARFASGASSLGISTTPSPISTGPVSAHIPIGRPVTPPGQALVTPGSSPAIAKSDSATKRPPHGLEPLAIIPQTPPRQAGCNVANEADNLDPGISPRSVARLSPSRRRPTPPSPEQEQRGSLATNFPLSTPAAPKRHDTQRSVSESIINLYTDPRTPEWISATKKEHLFPEGGLRDAEALDRSKSLRDPSKARMTPERPARPQHGLFDTPQAKEVVSGENATTPPRTDVMAEATRNSPDQALQIRPPLERGLSNSSNSGIPGPTQTPSRTGSVGSAHLRERAGSAGSSTVGARPPPPPRKDSTGSGSSIPFVIAMGSPHNPALMTPLGNPPTSTCSITGKAVPTTTAALRIQSPTSRTGVGGTMASTTPVTSPISPTDVTRGGFFGSALPVNKGPFSHAESTSRRNASVSGPIPSRNPKENGMRGVGGHSRSVSGSSIMTAIQRPGSLMKGKGKTRKDSISNPTPLASPFDIDRSNGSGSKNFGIGEAI